jgi:hypothetical protein
MILFWLTGIGVEIATGQSYSPFGHDLDTPASRGLLEYRRYKTSAFRRKPPPVSGEILTNA